jgi:hypothetical protein
MLASVSRFLRRAEQLISNVEYGKFPVFSNHEKPELRFTARQLERHKELEAVVVFEIDQRIDWRSG